VLFIYNRGVVLVAMSEELWRHCSEINPMFAAMEPTTEAQLALFNLECCRRIRQLITDDILLQALDALAQSTDHLTISAELALAVNQATMWTTKDAISRLANADAASAVGHAVCRSLPPGSFHYWKDPVDNARLVALKCQWAVGKAADPHNEADDEDPYGENSDAEPGLNWLRQRAQRAEAAAQCDIFRSLFTRRIEPVPS
jgi:hypothetical protein